MNFVFLLLIGLLKFVLYFIDDAAIVEWLNIARFLVQIVTFGGDGSKRIVSNHSIRMIIGFSGLKRFSNRCIEGYGFNQKLSLPSLWRSTSLTFR